jgi:hypothetical protein
MRIESKLMAVGLSAAAFVAGCGNNSNPENTLRVGQNEWVQVAEPITRHYVNADQELRIGDECVIVRGSELILKNGGVVYENNDALGTECPDGAKIKLTPAQAKAQNASYQSFANRRDEVTSQVSEMSEPIGEPVDGSGDWVDLVNPEPVEQVFTNATVKIGYGDSCIADGEVQKIGQLTTGEAVMQVVNPDQLGTECPSGAIYLAQS